MKQSVNILCLYWVGKFRGRNFSIEDVIRLYQSVRKHIDRPFQFYCLTNSDEVFPEYIQPIPLIYAWPGWWSKIEIHRPDLPEGRTLYMDLDSHVVKSLQLILDYPGDLVMFETRIPKHKWAVMEKKGWVLRYQAATMLFTPGTDNMQSLWKKFVAAPLKWMARYRSDQDVMGDWFPNQPTFPGDWMIKAETVLKLGHIPETVIIVTGQPKAHSFREVKLVEQIAR